MYQDYIPKNALVISRYVVCNWSVCVCVYSNYVLAVKLQCYCNVGLLLFKLTKHAERVQDINDWVKLKPPAL